MKISRPIIFFDIEATGLSIINDRIVQVSFLKIYPDGKEETKTYQFNPEIRIPDEVIAIHGINNEMVVNSPLFKTKAREIVSFLTNCDLAGFNLLKFDVPMLMEEFIRAEIDFEIDNRHLIDVQAIYHKMEQRTLSAAYKFYCNKDLTNAHDAEADTLATYEVFKA